MYPVFLDIHRMLCVVIGGGSVAERKVKGLLESGALVKLVSPEVSEDLAALAREERIEWRKKVYTPDDLTGAFLVFAATDNREIQDLICFQAQERGQLVNVADDPGCCNFHVPASIRRGDLTLAISTRGKSPAVAAMIRQNLEKEFGPEYGTLLHLMSLVRQHAGTGSETLSQADRKKIYKKILHSDIIGWIRSGRLDKLDGHLREILGTDAELIINTLKPDCS
jgi:precorrin-2 dehydrogenase/sirohydrochlorin ferrochelatase